MTMKKIIKLLIISTVILTGCDSSKTDTFLKENTLFSIVPTTDPTFCSLDSIVPTDCGVGEVYLTKEGGVLYSPFCMGMDSFTYYIGKYNISDTAIICTFNSEYTYAMGCYDCPEEETKPEDPNSGKIISSKEWFLTLKKTNCSEIPYYLSNSKDDYRQGLKTNPDKNDYCKSISEIKALSEFHCAFTESTSNSQSTDNTPTPNKMTNENLVSEDIITQILIHYGRENKSGLPQKKETDSLIYLSFKEKGDEMAYSNLTISKIKGDYFFADLNGDGKLDILASVNADSGGSSFWDDLIVFLYENESYSLTSVTTSFDLATCKSGSHDGQFYPKEIKNGVIIGESVCYTDEDAHCCPSIKQKSKAVFKDNKLVKTN